MKVVDACKVPEVIVGASNVPEVVVGACIFPEVVVDAWNVPEVVVGAINVPVKVVDACNVPVEVVFCNGPVEFTFTEETGFCTAVLVDGFDACATVSQTEVTSFLSLAFNGFFATGLITLPGEDGPCNVTDFLLVDLNCRDVPGSCTFHQRAFLE